MEGMNQVSTQAMAFERGESVGFNDVPGFVVLLDAGMKEVVPRQQALFSWALTPGGATYEVTSPHEFDIMGKSISYVAVGHDDEFMFVSIVVSRPVHGAFMNIGKN